MAKFFPAGPGCWALGFGFWVLGFGFWVLGFELKVSGIGSWVLGFGFRALGFELKVSGIGSWVLGLGFRALQRVLGLGLCIPHSTCSGAWGFLPAGSQILAKFLSQNLVKFLS